MYLARIISRQARYAEAETVLKDVIQRHHYQSSGRDDGEHPDRLMAMWFLANCYDEQGQIENAVSVCKDIEHGLIALGGQNHPFAEKVRNRKLELETAFTSPEIWPPTTEADAVLAYS